MHGYNMKFTVPQRPHKYAAEQHFVHSRACSCHLCLLPGQPVTPGRSPMAPSHSPSPHTTLCFLPQAAAAFENVKCHKHFSHQVYRLFLLLDFVLLFLKLSCTVSRRPFVSSLQSLSPLR